MTDITIPDAAVEAAARALDANFNPDYYPILSAMFSDYAMTALTAAAPFIAAQALRDADAEVSSYAYTPDDVREVGQGDYADGITDAHHVFERLLNARANRIEADHG